MIRSPILVISQLIKGNTRSESKSTQAYATITPPCSEIHNRRVPYYYFRQNYIQWGFLSESFSVSSLQWRVKITTWDYLCLHPNQPSVFIKTPGWTQWGYLHSILAIQHHRDRSGILPTKTPIRKPKLINTVPYPKDTTRILISYTQQVMRSKPFICVYVYTGSL